MTEISADPVFNKESSTAVSEHSTINLEAASCTIADPLKTDEVYLFPLNSVSLRVVLEEFYSLYNPERKSTISIIIEKYENNQLELFKSLKERYNISEYKPFDDLIRTLDPVHSISSTITDATPPPTTARQQQLGSNSNTGIGGLSAAISLNMQDIAGVSSNLLAGTAGRLFTGVSWGLTTNNNLSNANTNSPSAKSKNGDAMEVKTAKASSAESGEAVSVASSGSAEIDSSIVTALDDESVSEIEGNNTSSKQKLQLAAVLKENSLLKNESTELKSKVDSLQRSMVDLLDRESVARKESLRLREQLSQCEEANLTLKKQMELEESKYSRKHAQLLECMQMNQRLTSQLEFIVVEAHRSSVLPLQWRQSGYHHTLLVQVEEDRLSAAAAFKQLFSATATADASTPHPPSPPLPCEISGEQEVEREIPGTTSMETLTEELSLARKRADHLLTSSMVSKLEIARAAQKEQEMAQAMLLQQAEIESLFKQLAAANEEKAGLLQQIAEHRHETRVDNERLAESQARLVATEKTCDNMRSELSASNARCRQLSEQLSLMEESTRQLRDGCNNIVRANEDKCARIVRCMQERFSLEREEFFSHLRELSEVRSALLGQVQQETSADLQRLRDEAFRARRAEVQKDRQISYLQSQLKEAASRLVGSLSSEQLQEKGRAT